MWAQKVKPSKLAHCQPKTETLRVISQKSLLKMGRTLGRTSPLRLGPKTVEHSKKMFFLNFVGNYRVSKSSCDI